MGILSDKVRGDLEERKCVHEINEGPNHECFTKEEVEKFMNDKKAFQDWLRKATLLYGAWDMVNDQDDIMLDHLYQVLYFFGVKNMGEKSKKPFVDLEETDQIAKVFFESRKRKFFGIKKRKSGGKF